MSRETANWVLEAKRLFPAEKPAHFTDYTHCCECAGHDETLRNTDADRIGLAELGNPGWDPMCFCSNEGKKYYMPALIQLSLETACDEFYFGQFLFHLEMDGEDNSLFSSCTKAQRRLIADFVEYMMIHHAEEIDGNVCADAALAVHRIWSAEQPAPGIR